MKLPLDWIVPDWPAPRSVRAFVTTRAGGVSQGPWGDGAQGGMNLGTATGDDSDAIRANHERLRTLLPALPCWLRQEHGARVVNLDALSPRTDNYEGDQGCNTNWMSGIAQADAALTMRPGVVAAVQVADCLPVLLTDLQGRAVAAVHAGWRGLAAGVIQDAVAALRLQLSTRGAEVVAWLGPAIGPLHFEVGAEVLAAMQARLPDAARAFTSTGGGKYRADLFALARQALQQAGVVQMQGGGLCTFSDPRRFYSFRRDPITRRHAALVWRSE